MFQMLAKLSIETGDPEADKFIKLVDCLLYTSDAADE